MDYDVYRKLKEIKSLQKKIKLLQKKQFGDNDRINAIGKMKDNRLKELENTNKEINNSEEVLEKILLEIDKMTQSISSLNNFSSTKTKTIYEKESNLEALEINIENSENESIALMEKIDSLNAKKNEIHTFLKGIDKSIKEIEEDVFKDISFKNKDISNINKRISSLKSEIELDMNINDLNISNISEDYCENCFQLLNKNIIQQVEKKESLVICPNCKSILLPHLNSF